VTVVTFMNKRGSFLAALSLSWILRLHDAFLHKFE
jgi:hypothetical protein